MQNSDARRPRGTERIQMAFNGLFVNHSAGAWGSLQDSPGQLHGSHDSSASPSSSSGATVIRHRSAQRETPERSDALRRSVLSPQRGGKQAMRTKPSATGYAQRHSQRAALAAAGGTSGGPFISPACARPQAVAGRSASPGPPSRQHRQQSQTPLWGTAISPSPKTDQHHFGTTASAVIAALAVDAAMPDIDPTARTLLEAIMGTSLQPSASLALLPQTPQAPAPSPMLSKPTLATEAIGHGQQAQLSAAAATIAPTLSAAQEGASLGQSAASRQRSQLARVEQAPGRAMAGPQPWPMPPGACALPLTSMPTRPASRPTSPRAGADADGSVSQRGRLSQEQLCKPGSASGSAAYDRETVLGAAVAPPAEPPLRERRMQQASAGSVHAPVPEQQPSVTFESGLGHKQGGEDTQGGRRRLGPSASDSDVQLPRRPPSSQSASSMQQVAAAALAPAGGTANTGSGTSPGRTLVARMCRSHAAGSLSSKNLRAMREREDSRRPTTYAELQAAAKPQSPADLSPVSAQQSSPTRLPPLPPSDGGALDDAVCAGAPGTRSSVPGDGSSVLRSSASMRTDADQELGSNNTNAFALRKSTCLSGKTGGDGLSDGRTSAAVAAVAVGPDIPGVTEEPDAGICATVAVGTSRRQRQEDAAKRRLLCGLLACFRRGAASPGSGASPEAERDGAPSPAPAAEAATQLQPRDDGTQAIAPSADCAADSAELVSAFNQIAPEKTTELAEQVTASVAAVPAAYEEAPFEPRQQVELPQGLHARTAPEASTSCLQGRLAPEAMKADSSPRTPRSTGSVAARPPVPPAHYHLPLQGNAASRYNDVAAARSGGGGGSVHQRLSRNASPRSHYSTDGGTQLVRGSMDESLAGAAARQHEAPHSRSVSRGGCDLELLDGTGLGAAAAAAVAAAASIGTSRGIDGACVVPQHRLSGGGLRESLLRATTEDSPAGGSPPGAARARAPLPASRRDTGSPRVMAVNPFQPPACALLNDFQRPKPDAAAARAPEQPLAGSAADILGLISALELGTGAPDGARLRKQSNGSNSSAGVQAPILSARKSRKRGRAAHPGNTLSQLDARKLATLPLEEMLEQIQAAMYAEDLARGRAGGPAAAAAGGTVVAEPSSGAASKPSRQGSMRRRRSGMASRSSAGGSAETEGAAQPKHSGSTGGGRRRRRVKALGRTGGSKRKARAEAAAAAALAAALQHGNKEKAKEAGQPAWRHGGRALAFNGLGIAGTSVHAPLPVAQAASQRASIDFLRQPPYKKTLVSKGSPGHVSMSASRRHIGEPATSPALRSSMPTAIPAPRYGQTSQIGTGEPVLPRLPQVANRKPKSAKQAVQPTQPAPAVQHTVITINPIPSAAATPMNTPAPAQRPLATSLDLSSLLTCCGGDVGVVIGAATKSPRGAATTDAAGCNVAKANSPSTSVKAATTALAELVKLMDNGVDSGAIAVAFMSAHAAADRHLPRAPLSVPDLATIKDVLGPAPAQMHAQSTSLGGMLGSNMHNGLLPAPGRPQQRSSQPGDAQSLSLAVENKQAQGDLSIPVSKGALPASTLADDVRQQLTLLSLGAYLPAADGGREVQAFGADRREADADYQAAIALAYRAALADRCDIRTSTDTMCLVGTVSNACRTADTTGPDDTLAAAVSWTDSTADSGNAERGVEVSAAQAARVPSHRRCASAVTCYADAPDSHQQPARAGLLLHNALPVASRRLSTTIGGTISCRNGPDDAYADALDAASSTADVGGVRAPVFGGNGARCPPGSYARMAVARQGLATLVTDTAAAASAGNVNLAAYGAEPTGSEGGGLAQRDLLSPSESVPGMAASTTTSGDSAASRSGSSGIVAMAMGERGPLSSPFKPTRRSQRAEVNPAPRAAAAVSTNDPSLLIEEESDGGFRRFTHSGSVTAYDIHAAAAAETPALVYNAALSPRSSVGGESYQPYQPLEDLPLRAQKSASNTAQVTCSASTSATSTVASSRSEAHQAPLPSPRQVALPATPRMPEGGNCGDWRCVSLEQYEQSLGDFDAYLAAQTSGSYDDE